MRRILVLIPLLFACSENDLSLLDTLPYEFGEITDERVRVDTFGDVRFDPDGPIVARGTGDGGGWFDVAIADDQLGVIVRADGAELVLFMDRQHAASWIVQPTRSLDRSGSRGSVAFDLGVPVEIIEESDDAVRVRYLGAYLDMEAWLPYSDVDQVLDGIDEAEHAPRGDEAADLWVAVPTVLFDAPDGTFLGELIPHRGTSGWQAMRGDQEVHQVAQLGPAEHGFLPVEVSDGRVHVTAWVDEADVLGTDGFMGMKGWGGSHTISSRCGMTGYGGSWPTVSEDTPIYDRPEGRLVGHYIQQTVLHQDLDDSDPWGWTPVTFYTEWGPVEGWLEPDAIEIR